MLNKAILMGRLTTDPEHRQTAGGVSVVSFSIAVDRNFSNADGSRQTDFINIVAWRSTADFICKYFSKGRMIVVEGAIQTRNYEDKNGNKRTAFEVVADQVYFGDSKSSGTATTATPFPTPSRTVSEPSVGTGFSVGEFEDIGDDDDSGLPF